MQASTHDAPCSARHEQVVEERLALASVLQELTVAALELFDPARSADSFLDRVAERLGCYAAVLVEVTPSGAGSLMGATGIGAASRELAVPADVAAALVAGGDVSLPYPELAGRTLQAWHFPVEAEDRAAVRLILYFQEDPLHRHPAVPRRYHGMVGRLARILGDVLTHRDLFARTRASERRLDEQKTMIERIGDASKTGIVVTREGGGPLLFANRCFATMLRLDATIAREPWEAVLGAIARETVDPEGYVARAKYLDEHPEAECLDEIHLRDGRVLECYTAPVRSRAGVHYGRGRYFLDVTERRAAEAERERLLETERAARAAAEEAIRARDEFLSIASHELRTPLSSMQLVVQLLRSAHDRPSSMSLDTLLQSVERQTRRLTRLTDELLDVSRLSAGRMQLEREHVDLVAICREVLSRFREELQRCHSTATLHADAPVVGYWDPSRIDQVVANLLSNAIKYGKGRPIEMVVSADEREARLEVRDRGLGIAPEHLESLFERFTRGVSARQYGGLGLGLYIVRQVVEMHGGRVSVSSTPDAGSTFTVVLPRGEHA